MATFFIGDVHGCSQELDRLLTTLGAGPQDQVLLTGDCFDRGPDPLGVLDLIRGRGLGTIMSNHEDYLCRCLYRQLQGKPLESRHDYILRCLEQVGGRSREFFDFLRKLPLHLEGPGWILVHAGIDPQGGLGATSRRHLLSMRTWPPEDPGAPLWYELYRQGPLVIFGHNAQRQPVLHRVDGRLQAIGLDTGCVYGGELTAFHLEEERLIQVKARRDYRMG